MPTRESGHLNSAFKALGDSSRTLWFHQPLPLVPLHPTPTLVSSKTSPLIPGPPPAFGLAVAGIGTSLVAQRIKHLPAMQRPGFDPWVGKIPWRRKWQPTPVRLPGESHGQRSLAGYSPRGHRESNTTERLHCTVLYCTVAGIPARSHSSRLPFSGHSACWDCVFILGSPALVAIPAPHCRPDTWLNVE